MFGRCCRSANKEEEDRSVVVRNKLRGGDLQWRWHDETAKLWQVCGGGVKVAQRRKMVAPPLLQIDGGASVTFSGVVMEDAAMAAGAKMVAAGVVQWWPARRWRWRLPWWVEGKLGLGFHV